MNYTEYIKKLIGRPGLLTVGHYGYMMSYGESVSNSKITNLYEDFVVIESRLPASTDVLTYVFPVSSSSFSIRKKLS